MIDIDRIMKQSSRAVCGAFEREILVDEKKVEAIKKALRSKGQFIVGTGKAFPGKKKVWYNQQGLVGL